MRSSLIQLGLIGLLLLWQGFLEYLDWYGRADVLRDKHPRLWAMVNNRPFRLVVLIVAVGLLAKDFRDLEAIGPPPSVTVKAPPAPIIQERPQKAPVVNYVLSTRPNESNSMFPWITTINGEVSTPFNNPQLLLKCKHSCRWSGTASRGQNENRPPQELNPEQLSETEIRIVFGEPLKPNEVFVFQIVQVMNERIVSLDMIR